MLRKLRSLSKFSPGEIFILLQFILFASIARVVLTFVALPHVIAFTARGANNRLLRCLPLFQNQYEMSDLTRLAGIAARKVRGDGPCLLRSLLIFWLLKARGQQAQLVIGVSKEDSSLDSHAWIESQGRIMFDGPEIIRRFATLLRF